MLAGGCAFPPIEQKTLDGWGTRLARYEICTFPPIEQKTLDGGGTGLERGSRAPSFGGKNKCPPRMGHPREYGIVAAQKESGGCRCEAATTRERNFLE